MAPRKSARQPKVTFEGETGPSAMSDGYEKFATAPNLDDEFLPTVNDVYLHQEFEFVLLDEDVQLSQLTEGSAPELANLVTVSESEDTIETTPLKAYLADWRTRQDHDRASEEAKCKPEMSGGPIVAHRSRVYAPETLQTSDGGVSKSCNTVSGAQKHSSASYSKHTSKGVTQKSDVDDESTGTYVQCCNTSCQKWRYLPHVKDPAAVPKHWICSMNADGKQNSCRAAERLGQDVDRHLVECSFTLGSVVWAKLPAYPWWPAIVDRDPDSEHYYWLDGSSRVASWYHVLFFDRLNKSIGRAWIRAKDICRLDQRVADASPATRKYWHPKLESNFLVAKRYAEDAAQMDLQKRRRVYCASSNGGGRKAKLPWNLNLPE